MNKNLLLIAAAAVGYALLRPKNVVPTSPYPTAATTGAASYVPAANSTTGSTSPSWLSNAAGGVATGVSILKTGIDLFGEIKGALAPTTARTTAATTAATTASPTADSGNIWAGPTYVTS